MSINEIEIRIATEEDVPQILSFIKQLAEYEKLLSEVTATEDGLRHTLFGERRYAEAILAYYQGEPVGFALFFHNYSTFMGQQGLYLEDLYVIPEARGKKIGFYILCYLAKLAVDRNCGRLEWSVLDWNEPAIKFYKSIGAKPMDEWTVNRLTGNALMELATGEK